jgi:hypothetical protein
MRDQCTTAAMLCAVFKSTSALAEKYMQGNTRPPEKRPKGGRKDPKDKAPGDNAGEGRRPQKKARKDGTRVLAHSFVVLLVHCFLRHLIPSHHCCIGAPGSKDKQPEK